MPVDLGTINILDSYSHQTRFAAKTKQVSNLDWFCAQVSGITNTLKRKRCA